MNKEEQRKNEGREKLKRTCRLSGAKYDSDFFPYFSSRKYQFST